MDVSIIIVNYNTASITLQCLESIYKFSKNPSVEIIVIDNKSSDNSFDIINCKFPDIKFISNSENIGFGRANNLGIAQAKGKYLFFLNSDTILLNDVIAFFFKFMEQHNVKEDIGAVGSIMLDRNMRLNFRNSYYFFPGARMLFKDLLRDIFKIARKYSDVHNNLVKDGCISVDFIVGADLFVPKKVLENIGLFDSDFFLYWEEVDLQYRMHKMKLKRLIIDGPQIIHLEGASSNNNLKNWQRITEAESLFKYLHKHKTILSVIFAKLYVFIIILSEYRKKKYSFREQLLFLKSVVKN